MTISLERNIVFRENAIVFRENAILLRRNAIVFRGNAIICISHEPSGGGGLLRSQSGLYHVCSLS